MPVLHAPLAAAEGDQTGQAGGKEQDVGWFRADGQKFQAVGDADGGAIGHAVEMKIADESK